MPDPRWNCTVGWEFSPRPYLRCKSRELMNAWVGGGRTRRCIPVAGFVLHAMSGAMASPQEHVRPEIRAPAFDVLLPLLERRTSTFDVLPPLLERRMRSTLDVLPPLSASLVGWHPTPADQSALDAVLPRPRKCLNGAATGTKLFQEDMPAPSVATWCEQARQTIQQFPHHLLVTNLTCVPVIAAALLPILLAGLHARRMATGNRHAVHTV
jgi:hypothetical protein